MQMPGRKYPVPEPLPLAGAGSPSSPIELYRHGFKSKASGTSLTYDAAPNTLSAYLDSSKWQLYIPGWPTSYFQTFASPVTSGPSMDSCLVFTTTPVNEVSTMTLTFQVKPGYRATLNSFSFYNRSTTPPASGYMNWRMTINGTEVGADTLQYSSTPLLSTGTLAIAGPISALTGTVTVVLHFSNSQNKAGSVRIDNFVLNGFVQQIPNSGNAPVTSADGKGYRYGFNGQEREREVGEDTYGALYWEYDSRIGRRWNIDPKAKCNRSPYEVFSGSPIVAIDPFGDDDFWAIDKKTGKIKLVRSEGTSKNIFVMVGDKYVLLSDIQISFKDKKFSQGMADLVATYAQRAGIKFNGNCEGEDGKFLDGLGIEEGVRGGSTLAYTYPTSMGKNMMVNVFNGHIDPSLSNSANLVNAIKHEEIHRDASSQIKSFGDHADVYIKQMNDQSFEGTDDDFKIATFASALDYIYNAKNGASQFRDDNERVDKLLASVQEVANRYHYTVNLSDDGKITIQTDETYTRPDYRTTFSCTSENKTSPN